MYDVYMKFHTDRSCVMHGLLIHIRDRRQLRTFLYKDGLFSVNVHVNDHLIPAYSPYISNKCDHNIKGIMPHTFYKLRWSHDPVSMHEFLNCNILET